MSATQSAGRAMTETGAHLRVCSPVHLNSPLKRSNALRAPASNTIMHARVGLLHAAQ